MANDQQFSLRWNNYQTHIVSAFESLRDEEDFVDVTLGCEGRKIRAHKMLLSACSPYFRELLKDNPCQHPIVILRDVHYNDLQALVEFMYNGQVNVSQDQLSSFLQTAEVLKIRGLAEGEDKKSTDKEPSEEVNDTNTPERTGLSTETESFNRPSVSHNKGTELTGRSTDSFDRGAESHGRESPPPKRKKKHQFSTENRSFTSCNQPTPKVEEITLVPEPEVLAVEVKAEVPDYESRDTSQDTGYDGCGDNVGDGVQEGVDFHSQPEQGLYGSGMLQSESGVSYGVGIQVTQQQQAEGTSNQSVSVVSKPGPSTAPDTGPDTSQAVGIWALGLPVAPHGIHSVGQVSSLVHHPTRCIGKPSQELFVCEVCQKGFSYRSSLFHHKKLHTGDTKCPVCSQIISRKSNLKRHMRQVHGHTGI